MTLGILLTVIVFVGLYVFLATEWVHRAVTALVAALLVVALGLVPVGSIVGAIDWNTLALLFGLMLLVLLLERAGLFGRLAALMWRGAAGSSAVLVLSLLVMMGAVSAVLPNITVILVFGPMVMATAESTGVSPMPLLVMAVAISNLGGLATLIGDPPNLLIGTGAHIGFGQFLQYAGPLAVLLIGAVLLWMHWVLPVPRKRVDRVTGAAGLPSRGLKRLLAVFGCTLAGFVLAGPLNVPLGLVGVAGGVLAVVISGADFEDLLKHLDWSTLVFFAGLFVVVASLETQGVIRLASHALLGLSVGAWLPILVMTGVAILSAFVDNIPIVAAAIPLVESISRQHPGYGLALWFSLAIGAAIGGNATAVGASANVVAVGVARARGYSLSFGEYLRWGLPVAGLTWGLAAAYMWWVPVPGR